MDCSGKSFFYITVVAAYLPSIIYFTDFKGRAFLKVSLLLQEIRKSYATNPRHLKTNKRLT